MFELAQQLSYYLNVVDGGATSKLVQYGQKIASIGTIATTARASLAAMVQPIEAVAQAWSGREQQINNITRSLRQYQYVGQSIADINREITRSMPGATAAERGAAFTRVYNDQFAQGRNVARGLIRDMNQMAAILPGEANDYMQSFSQNLPFLSQARGMTDTRAARLTSYLTAGGIAGGVDSQQSARDLMQFMTNGPHITDRSWTEVWSQYAQRNNGQRVTASQIHGMTATQRVEILENIARQLQPMMDATGDSYEALKGTLNSFRHELYLFATEPLFEAWKRILSSVASQLTKLNDALGPVLRVFATLGSYGLDAVQSRIKFVVEDVVNWLNRMPDHIRNFGLQIETAKNELLRFRGLFEHGKATVAKAGTGTQQYAQAHVAPGGTTATLGTALLRFFAPEMLLYVLLRFFGVALGPIGLLISSLLVRLFTGPGASAAVATLMTALGSLWAAVVSLVGGTYRLVEAFMDAAVLVSGDLFISIISGLLMGVQMFLEGVMLVMGLIANVLGLFFLPLLVIFTPAIALLQIVIEVFGAFIRVLVSFFAGASGASYDFIDAIRDTSAELQRWKRSLMEDVWYLMNRVGLLSDSEYQARMRPAAQPAAVPAWADRVAGMFRRSDFDIEEGGGSRTGHAPANRPQVHQDFRYSRFDITQKFADGFSPERVAAAFVGDLESMASQRLSSGFAPAFSNG